MINSFPSKATRIFGCTIAILAVSGIAAAAQSGQDAGRHQRTASLRDACSADSARLCNGVQPGGGRIKACIKSHQSELSDSCCAALSHAKQSK